MPRRKPSEKNQINKKVQEEIKNSLDAILEDDLYNDDALSPAELPRMKSSAILDIDQEKQNVSSDSKMLLTSIAEFYLENNLIEKSAYIQFKQKMEEGNISSMMLQMKTAQHAIGKLVEEIDMGNTAPKMFEVLAQLQSQIMQMTKDYQNYFTKMEDSYKGLREEGETRAYRGSVPTSYSQGPQNQYEQIPPNVDPETGEYLEANTQGDQRNSGGVRARGTKSLMEGLRTILGSEIEDVNLDDITDPSSVVNAKKKIEMGQDDGSLKSNNIDSIEVEDDLF
jgi:hypothetical protein